MKSLKVMMTLLIVATITIFTSCSGNNDNPKRKPSIVDLNNYVDDEKAQANKQRLEYKMFNRKADRLLEAILPFYSKKISLGSH